VRVPFASVRTWEYRESMARDTCPAMLMITALLAPDSESSVNYRWGGSNAGGAVIEPVPSPPQSTSQPPSRCVRNLPALALGPSEHHP
jgi:hypothetical protein